MTDLRARRSCVKYGSIMTDSWRVRIFCFDTETQKYRYFQSKEDVADKAKKAMDLARCEYEITERNASNAAKWEDYPNKGSKYRLSMKFEQRERRPIYYYSNDLDELCNLKDYGIYCQKGPQSVDKLEQLLCSLNYGYESFAFNLLVSLHQKLLRCSKIMMRLVSDINGGVRLMQEHKKYLLTVWAKILMTRSRRYRPLATIRLSHFLCSLARIKSVNEERIIRATQEILKAYKQHRRLGQEVFDEAITEKASRSARGVSASIEFSVSDKVLPIASGRQAVPREHMGFVKFEFPQRAFREAQGEVAIDGEELKVRVSSKKSHKVLGELLIGDISSMVLNDDLGEDKKWLRINGKKIQSTEEFSNSLNKQIEDILNEKEENELVDPGRKFLALSNDSYLSKKSLLEVKLYSVRVKDISDIVQQLGTKRLRLRVKVSTRDIFSTTTAFMKPKMKDEGMSCELKIVCRIRVDVAMWEFVDIGLFAIAAEKNRVPDVLKTLKKEINVGFTKISLLNLPKQKKIMWIPLNGGISNEDPFLNPKQPIASMSLRLIKDVNSLPIIGPRQLPRSPASRKSIQHQRTSHIHRRTSLILSKERGGVQASAAPRHKVRRKKSGEARVSFEVPFDCRRSCFIGT